MSFAQRYGFMKVRWIATATWAFLVGMAMLFVIAALTGHAKPNLECEGRHMSPGDTCEITTYIGGQSHRKVETYSDRVEAADKRNGNRVPAIVFASVVGTISVTGFALIWLPGKERFDRYATKVVGFMDQYGRKR